ncbi:MAG: hypothetical protein WCP70_08190 [Methanothrix sp.]
MDQLTLVLPISRRLLACPSAPAPCASQPSEAARAPAQDLAAILQEVRSLRADFELFQE